MSQIYSFNHFDKDAFEMRSLNLDQLRTLVEVVRQGSFSAAARRLCLTQPAESLQIRELERRFGVRLIERLGKQAHATMPGRQLVEAAEQVFRECDRAEQVMRRFREGWIGRVRLGSTLTTMVYRLPPILRRLRLENPGVELVHSNMPTGESVENVVQNTLDLALVNLPVENRQLEITPLCREVMVAIFPPGSRGLPDAVTPDFAAQQQLMVEQTRSAAHAFVLGWLAGRSRAYEPMALGTVETLKTAVASGLGMAIVPEVAVTRHRRDFVVRPLQPSLPRTLALIERRNKPNEPALEIVRNALLTLRDGTEANADAVGPQGRRRRLGRAAAKTQQTIT
jgi:DNA-binding transcriptional LysR family regulator